MTDTARIPEKPALEGLETKWGGVWEDRGTYRFDRDSATRECIYSIDTPPPTASGSLHIGHVFSYTHTDVVARFQRMRGKHVFYPMAGTTTVCPPSAGCRTTTASAATPRSPTSRASPRRSRAARARASRRPTRCRSRAATSSSSASASPSRTSSSSRPCGAVSASRSTGQSYRTIADEALFTSQLAFVRNVERGEAYQALAPTLWDVTFRTAVAQAELEDREQPGHYHRVAFHRPDGGTVEIETSRPELLRRASPSSPIPTTSATSRSSAPL